MTKWKPEIGQEYYVPDIANGKSGVLTTEWNDDNTDHTRYEAGIVFQDIHEAVKMAKRMLCMVNAAFSSIPETTASGESPKLEKVAGILGVAPYQPFKVKDGYEAGYWFYLADDGLYMVDAVGKSMYGVRMNGLLADLLFGNNRIEAEAVWVPFARAGIDGGEESITQETHDDIMGED